MFSPQFRSSEFEDTIKPKYGNTDTGHMSGVLKLLLGIEYVLYTKTQNFHWNLTGVSFIGLHELLGKHYSQLSEYIDQIAEQIRKYGQSSPGSLQEFLVYNDQAGGIEESPGVIINEKAVLSKLIIAHEKVIQSINSLELNRIDLATQNMLGNILDFHMKAVWMYRAHLE